MAEQTTSGYTVTDYYNIPRYFHEVHDDIRIAFRGDFLRVGDKAPGFRLTTIDGDVAELDELRNDGHVALIFGCHSAPPLVAEMPAFELLAERASTLDSRLVFIYTREIHPNQPLPPHGARYPHHVTFDQKLAQARAFRDELGLTMMICVDDLAGSAHRSYGSQPHGAVVVHRDGTLMHRSEKGSADLLGVVLENLAGSSGSISDLAHNGPNSFSAPPTPSYSETLWLR